MTLQSSATAVMPGRRDGTQLEAPKIGTQTPHQFGNRAFNDVALAEAAFKRGDVELAEQVLYAYFASSLAGQGTADHCFCRAKFLLGQIKSFRCQSLKGSELVNGILKALEPIIQGINTAAQNPRYGFLVYNGSVNFWHVSRPLQCQGLFAQLLSPQQQVVDAVRKLPGKQEWLSRLLLQTALAQLEAGKPEDAIKSVEEAQQLSKASGAAAVINQAAITAAHLQQVTGKAPKAATKAKAPAKPAAGKATGKGKEAAQVDPAVQREQTASLLGSIQLVRSANSAAGQEDRLKEVWDQVEQDGAGINGNLGILAQLGWVAALQGLPDLAERCASKAAASQDMGPRNWADLIRLQQQLAQQEAARSADDAMNTRQIAGILDKLETALTTFSKLHDVDGVHAACRLVWNAALSQLGQKLSKQLKRVLTTAAQALAAIGSPLHSLRATLHLEIAKGDVADDMTAKAALEIKKAQALDYLASQQEQTKWDLERPLDRFIDPLNQMLMVKTAAEDPETQEERVILLLERAREAKNPTTRGLHLSKALVLLTSLPAVKPPAPEDPIGSARSTQHAAARLRLRQLCDIAAMASAAGLDEVVRQACPLALAQEWAAEVDPEVVRWQAEASLLEAKAAVLACQKLRVPLVEPPAEAVEVPTDPVTHARKPHSDAAHLQQLVPQALLQAMKLASAAKQPWLLSNVLITLWNTYLPNLQQQRLSPLLYTLAEATAQVLAQPDAAPYASLLFSLVTSYASAAEHATMLAVLAIADSARTENATTGDSAATKPSPDLQRARLLAAPHLAAASRAPTPAAAPKGAKGAAKTDAAGAIPAANLTQLQQAAEACEAAMTKLSPDSTASGGQQLLEAYARLQQLRGLPATIPANSSPALQQISKVVATIEALSAPTAAPDASKAEADVQQALSLLAMQQPISLEMHAKLAKAAFQAGAMTGAVQCANAVLAAGLPKGRSAADIVDVEDAPGVAQRDWQWLAVGSLVLGQAIMTSNEADLPSQTPAVQLQLRKLCMAHALAAARFACFADRPQVLQAAAQACWNICLPLTDSAEGRTILAEKLEDLAGLMCELKCQDAAFQVDLVCLVSQCTADSNRWEAGLRHCENAMGVLPAAVHLPLSKWKVVFLSMLGRNIEDEMRRIAERGSQHAAAAWTSIAVHASKPEEQLQARQQAVVAVQDDTRLKARYMTALGEWLVQQGSAKEAGKEVLLEAAALLDPPQAPAQQHPVADLDLLLRMFTILTSASNTYQEQSQFASKAHAYAVAMLQGSLLATEDSPTTDSAQPITDWTRFELTPAIIQSIAASASPTALSSSTIAVPELTLRYIGLLSQALQDLGWHLQAIPLCHLEALLARTVLSSPALMAASNLRLASLAEALGLSQLADKAQQQAGALQLTFSTLEESHKHITMREFVQEASLDVFTDSSSTPSRPRSRKTARSGASRQSNRAGLSSRGSTAASSRGKQDRAELVATAQLQQFADAEAWLSQGLWLVQHGQYVNAKDLLAAALAHFRAFGDSNAAAKSLLGLAELQLLINQPQLGLEHVQQAARLASDVNTKCTAVSLLAQLHDSMAPDKHQAVCVLEEGISMMQQIARDRPGLAVESQRGAAALLLQQGRLHCALQQQAAGQRDPPDGSHSHGALACFTQAATCLQAFGYSSLHAEALQAQAHVLMPQGISEASEADPARGLKMLQEAEAEARYMYEAAVAHLPPKAEQPKAASPAPVEPVTPVPQGKGTQPKGAAGKTPTPPPQVEAPTPDPDPSLPAARQLAAVLASKAEALLTAAQALQKQQEGAASFAVLGKDAAAVKQYLADAGLLAAGAIAGHYEAEAVTAALAALQLSSLPSDCCHAHLALGRAHLALHSIQLGPAGYDAAWTGAPAAAIAAPPAALPGTNAAVEVASDVQAEGHRQLAVSSLQSCIASALTAGDLPTAITAAELVLSCLGMTDAQQATEALLLAQSCQAVLKMEALFSTAAAPQARERLLLRLREHIKSSLTCAEVTSAWQQCLQQIQQETCIGPRLALQPTVAHILGSMAPSTYIVSLHVSQDGSLLYCAALRGQQTAPPVKGKAGKQDVPTEGPQKPDLAKVPLQPGALQALQAKLKAYTAAKQHSLLTVADSNNSTANAAGREEELNQQYLAVLTELEKVLGSAAPLLTPPAGGPPDNKGTPQPSCPVLLLLDYSLAVLPWEGLPQLQQASAVARDFSLHVQYSRATGTASSQGFALKQLSYIVDPCVEHTPATSTAPGPPSPAKSATAKAAPKPGTAVSASAPNADKASRSLIQAFQQDVIAVHGKAWDGITGDASFAVTNTQYEQLLRSAAGVVYCGLGCFLSYVAPAVVASADMKACQLAVLLDRAHTAQSVKHQQPSMGADLVLSPAATSLLLTLRGVQTVVLSTLPSPVINLPDWCAQLMQHLQSKPVAEAVQLLRKSDHCGLEVYGLLSHKAASK